MRHDPFCTWVKNIRFLHTVVDWNGKVLSHYSIPVPDLRIHFEHINAKDSTLFWIKRAREKAFHASKTTAFNEDSRRRRVVSDAGDSNNQGVFPLPSDAHNIVRKPAMRYIFVSWEIHVIFHASIHPFSSIEFVLVCNRDTMAKCLLCTTSADMYKTLQGCCRQFKI